MCLPRETGLRAIEVATCSCSERLQDIPVCFIFPSVVYFWDGLKRGTRGTRSLIFYQDMPTRSPPSAVVLFRAARACNATRGPRPEPKRKPEHGQTPTLRTTAPTTQNAIARTATNTIARTSNQADLHPAHPRTHLGADVQPLHGQALGVAGAMPVWHRSGILVWPGQAVWHPGLGTCSDFACAFLLPKTAV